MRVSTGWSLFTILSSLCHNLPSSIRLFHTFSGGCSQQFGDRVNDTAPQKEANYGCEPELEIDTCVDDPGLDPIHNFLDYSDDVCMYHFTEGQAVRMREMLETYRTPGGNEMGLDFVIPLRDGVSAGPYSVNDGGILQFSLDVPSTSTVACKANGEAGDLDLFMNWNGSFERFECSEESPSVDEICSIGPDQGTAFILIYGAKKTTNIQISCTVVS